MDITTIIMAASIPSVITAFCSWLIQRRINKRDEEDKEEREARQKELDKRERVREESQLHVLKCVQASLALGEATAKAVQRIPDAKCNGDMHRALEYAEKVKHEQKDFLQEQAVKKIN